MGSITHHGDAVKWAKEYSGPLFHALLCDAPYEMGFMGRDWDSSGVAFNPDTWEAFSRVLYPGAFLFVSAGTINDDLISVAMRQAGLRKFHKMMGWVYGSGFPKASRIDTQIDKAAGAEQERDVRFTTAPATPLAQTWAGHRYGLQVLKPAIETVLIFQKPYEGRPVDCITRTGAGALWIDGARIGTEDVETRGKRNGTGTSLDWSKYTTPEGWQGGTRQGRWASNFYLVGDEAARRLDEQSGHLTASFRHGDRGNHTKMPGSVRIGDGKTDLGYSDSGGASRFFLRVDEQIDEEDPIFYSAKASRGERESGLFGLLPCVKCGRLDSKTHVNEQGRTVNCIRNSHTTVKPLSLCKHIATLLLPPIEYAPRRLFVPFAGVGSEQIGAVMAGWEEVEGVELDLEGQYIPINEARRKYWEGRDIQGKKPSPKSNGSKPSSNGHKPKQPELI